jgi:HlyD family secretion protein
VVISLGGSKVDAGVAVEIEVTAVRDLVATVRGAGTLRPARDVEVAPQTVARIKALHVAEGDRVTAGQLLVELESEELSAQHASEVVELRIARARQRQAESAYAHERQEYRRADKLMRMGAFAQADLERLAASVNARKAEARIAAEGVSLGLARVEQAAARLQTMVLSAPMAGEVVEVRRRVGEVVVGGAMNPSDSTIVVVGVTSEMVAVVDIDESDVVTVRAGQPASLTVDAVPDQRYRGTVLSVARAGHRPASSPNVTFFRVKIAVTDADDTLRVGMSTQATIEIARKNAAVVVPLQAVRPAGPDDCERCSVVFVANGPVVERRVVETGISDATHVEISHSLQAREPVVAGPYRVLRNLADGDAVQIVK